MIWSGNTIKGLSLGLFSTVCWSTYYVAGRLAFGNMVDNYDPFVISFLRSLLCVLCFIPIILASAERRKQTVKAIRKDWIFGLAMGFCGVTADGLLIFLSLKWTTAARASLMANASPIFTVLIATVLLREKIKLLTVTGMIMGFVSIANIILSPGSDQFSGAATWPGDLMALASGFFWATYTVYGVKLTEKYDLYVAAFIAFFWGTILCGLSMLINGSSFNLAAVPWQIWACAAYTGILGSFAAFCAWLKALTYISPSKLGAYGYISALLSATFSLMLLNEQFTPAFIIPAIGALIGVALMMR